MVKSVLFVQLVNCCTKIAILFCLFSLLNESFAEVNLRSKTAELARLQSKIKLVVQNLDVLQDKKNTLLAELKKLDLQYGQNSLQLRQLTEQIENLQTDLKQTSQHIRQKQKQIDKQKAGLTEQIRAAYAIGKNGTLKLLLNQQNVLLSGRIINYYQYLSRVRLKEITRVVADIDVLQALEKRKQEQMRSLTHAVTKAKQQRTELVLTRSKRQDLLEKINRRFRSQRHQLNRFKRSEKRLKSLVLSLQKVMEDFPYDDTVKAFSQLKGKLPWPVNGKLIKKFAAKRADSRWDGVLIQAREGTEIHAVTRGRVVYADWLRGSGLLTIIDHGKGFMTLYAFSQSLFKTVGDWVDPGTVIATVGTSGGQSKPALYFAIRKKGKPVNPEKWCQSVKQGQVKFKP